MKRKFGCWLLNFLFADGILYTYHCKAQWWVEFQKTKGGAYDKPVAESSLTLESIPNEWALPTIMHKVNLIVSLNMGRSQGGRR
jgi:hypothetical protein